MCIGTEQGMAQNSKRDWTNPEDTAANSNLRAKKQFTNKFNSKFNFQ
jgi:hypothetical protein